MMCYSCPPLRTTRYDTLFIYCDWVPTQWQWFLHMYTKGKNSNVHKEKQYR